MDAILPPAPQQQAAAGAYPIPQQVQPQQPQLQPGMLPRGRPPADPEVAEAKAQRHQERRRVEGVMPKKALDSKILIYRTKRGRPIPGAKPVCTVLISELEAATADGAQDPEEYLRSRLAEKIGDRDPTGVFQAVTVDRRGARISEVPPFDLTLTDDGGEEDDDDPEDEDDGPGGFDPGESEDYDFRGQHPLPPPAQQQAPAPTHVDLAVVDDIGRRNRDEEKSKSSENTALLLGMFQSMAQQQAAAQQQQTQLFLSVMQANQQKADAGGGTMVALITALAPVLAKVLEPKPVDTSTRDLMLPLIMKLLEKDKDRVDPGAEMMKTIPQILGEVSKQQIAMSNLGAESTVRNSAKMNELLMNQMMTMARDVAAQAKPQEKGEGGGMSQIAQIAAAVLPALMGNRQQAPPEPGYDSQQPQQALPAPEPQPEPAPAPNPAPRRRAAKTPPPQPAAAAEPAPAPAPVRPPPTEESRIRGCLQTIRKLEDGSIGAEKRWEALKWVLDRAPERVKVAIRAQSTEKVMQECAAAVLPEAALLTWVSDSEHIDFLTDALDDVRLLEAGQVTEEHAAAKVAALRVHQAKGKTAAEAARAAKQAAEDGKPPPQPAAPAPAAAETPAPAPLPPVVDAVVAPEGTP